MRGNPTVGWSIDRQGACQASSVIDSDLMATAASGERPAERSFLLYRRANRPRQQQRQQQQQLMLAHVTPQNPEEKRREESQKERERERGRRDVGRLQQPRPLSSLCVSVVAAAATDANFFPASAKANAAAAAPAPEEESALPLPHRPPLRELHQRRRRRHCTATAPLHFDAIAEGGRGRRRRRIRRTHCCFSLLSLSVSLLFFSTGVARRRPPEVVVGLAEAFPSCPVRHAAASSAPMVALGWSWRRRRRLT